MAEYTPYAYTGEGGQPAVLACCVVFFAFTPIFVALRLYSRMTSGVGLWWDDWACFLALPIMLAFNGLVVWDIRCGLGAFPKKEILGNLEYFFRGFYVQELLYDAGLSLVKLSILLLYQRVFPTREMTIVVWVLSFLVFGWFVGTGFAIIFQCNPIEGAWNKEIGAKCHVVSTFVLGQAVSSIVIDALIFVAPLRSVFQLHMPIGRKIAISGIFLLGFFAVACSVVRVPYALASPKTHNKLAILYNFPPGVNWTNAEMHVALICSCLPTIRPVLSRLSSRVFGTPNSPRGISSYGSNGYQQTTSVASVSNKPKDIDGGNSRLLDRGNLFGLEAKSAATARPMHADDLSDDIELGDVTYNKRHSPHHPPRPHHGGIEEHGIGMRRDVEVYTE